jgi:hypothetical protein
MPALSVSCFYNLKQQLVIVRTGHRPGYDGTTVRHFPEGYEPGQGSFTRGQWGGNFFIYNVPKYSKIGPTHFLRRVEQEKEGRDVLRLVDAQIPGRTEPAEDGHDGRELQKLPEP